MKDELEFDVESLEISEGRRLYLYKFGEQRATAKAQKDRQASREADGAEGRQSNDDAPA